MPALLDEPLACVDLETTGGIAAHHRVIEIGVVLMDGGAVVEEWSSLVNPGCRIPGNIQRFTGISDDMVTDAPGFPQLCDELLGRLEGRLFVAHNARFDYSFLRSEFRRVDARFRAPVLCTVRLSRLMDPQARGHNLDAVMERYGLSCAARHRALGDARVLAGLLPALRRRHEPAALDSAVRRLVQERRLPAQLDPGLADELPEGPGVYRFYGEGDVLLHVGQSRSLRTRILAHFDGERRSAREQKLARQLRRIDWAETAGEIGALLKEARWVKELAPLHNRRLRASSDCWTILLRAAGESLHARVEILQDAGAGGATGECHGLFRSRRDANRALDQLVRAHGLCARALGVEPGEGSCLAFQVGRCRGACCGQEPEALHAVRARMALAAHKLRDWPFTGRIGIRETDWRGLQELHVFDRWRHLGTVTSAAAIDDLGSASDIAFDLDCYRILCRVLDRPPPRARLVELD